LKLLVFIFIFCVFRAQLVIFVLTTAPNLAIAHQKVGVVLIADYLHDVWLLFVTKVNSKLVCEGLKKLALFDNLNAFVHLVEEHVIFSIMHLDLLRQQKVVRIALQPVTTLRSFEPNYLLRNTKFAIFRVAKREDFTRVSECERVEGAGCEFSDLLVLEREQFSRLAVVFVIRSLA